MNIIALHFFFALVLHIEIDLPLIIKRVFRIRRSKELFLIDCFPCFCFWGSLVATYFAGTDNLVPVYVFIIAKFYEKLRS